jgi:hypothetical protein
MSGIAYCQEHSDSYDVLRSLCTNCFDSFDYLVKYRSGLLTSVSWVEQLLCCWIEGRCASDGNKRSFSDSSVVTVTLLIGMVGRRIVRLFHKQAIRHVA